MAGLAGHGAALLRGTGTEAPTRGSGSRTSATGSLDSCEALGTALDVTGGSRDNGAMIIQWDWHGGDNQRWPQESCSTDPEATNPPENPSTQRHPRTLEHAMTDPNSTVAETRDFGDAGHPLPLPARPSLSLTPHRTTSPTSPRTRRRCQPTPAAPPTKPRTIHRPCHQPNPSSQGRDPDVGGVQEQLQCGRLSRHHEARQGTPAAEKAAGGPPQDGGS